MPELLGGQVSDLSEPPLTALHRFGGPGGA
ncbi:Uncharacterised protein [Mycobacteroides abscessus subsp. massiliense]|nr:Uncharacterised protein [Mycobacteroides abscessus subsp. massiliense]